MTATPGQVAYEAYCAAYPRRYPSPHFLPWDVMVDVEKQPWEAAAQAVLALKEDAP